MDGPREGNPYLDVELSVACRQEGDGVTVPGFYDGDGVYRVRFSPPAQGPWRYETRSNRPELNGKSGSFTAGPPSASNHGPVRVFNWYFSAPQEAPERAALERDRKTTYNPGPVGTDVGPLAIGNFNSTMRRYGLDRQFRGEIRGLQLFGSRVSGRGALDQATLESKLHPPCHRDKSSSAPKDTCSGSASATPDELRDTVRACQAPKALQVNFT